MDDFACSATAERSALRDILCQLSFSNSKTGAATATSTSAHDDQPSQAPSLSIRYTPNLDGIPVTPLCREDAQHQAIAAQLEIIIQSQVAAINTRDFSSSSALRLHKTTSWESYIGLLADEKLEIEAYMESWSRLANQFPCYHMRCIDIAISVDESKTFAETYTNIETTGMPEGVLRRQVGIATFRFLGGQWLMARQRTLPGIDLEQG